MLNKIQAGKVTEKIDWKLMTLYFRNLCLVVFPCNLILFCICLCRDAVEFLSSEGHIYSTIDDDHYKATDS